MNSSNTQDRVECQFYYFFSDDLNEQSKVAVRQGVRNWVISNGGSTPEVVGVKEGSWGEVLVVWLPSAIASGIIGWAASKMLDSGFHILKKRLLSSSESKLIVHEADSVVEVRTENVRSAELITIPKHDADSSFAKLGGLLEAFPSDKQPQRVAFIALGKDGRAGEMVCVNLENGNPMFVVGENEDLSRTAHDLIFRQ